MAGNCHIDRNPPDSISAREFIERNSLPIDPRAFSRFERHLPTDEELQYDMDDVQSMIYKNPFTVDRGLIDYSVIFGEEFLKSIHGNWWDIGSGASVAQAQYHLQKNLTIRKRRYTMGGMTLGMSSELEVAVDRRNQFEWEAAQIRFLPEVQTTAVGLVKPAGTDLLESIIRKLIPQVSHRYLEADFLNLSLESHYDSADIMTDLYGGLTYSFFPSKVLGREVAIQKTGGKLFLFIDYGAKVFVKAEEMVREMRLLDWVRLQLSRYGDVSPNLNVPILSAQPIRFMKSLRAPKGIPYFPDLRLIQLSGMAGKVFLEEK